MRCRNCGHEIPGGMLYCDVCGQDIQIVPDYNPLDDMLTEQIKVSIDGNGTNNTDYLVYDDAHLAQRRDMTRRNTGRTGAERTHTGRTGRTGAERTHTGRTGRTGTGRMNTGRTTVNRTGYIDGRGPVTKEELRRQRERKRARLKKKRRKVLLMLGLIIAFLGAVGFLIYQNSYAGMVRKGYKAIDNQEFSLAQDYFKKAMKKNDGSPEAYTGMAQTYVIQSDLNGAENVFKNAIAKQRKNADIYRACIQFYIDTEQPLKIPILLDDSEENVQEELAEYVVSRPKFSLDAEEPFDDVQQLSLDGGGMTMHYTTDGSDPTFSSKKYKGPIQIGEGETTIKVFAVNDDGIPSAVVEKIYMVEFPIEEAPAVSPSTGQYEEATRIEIKVPDGYEAYYTTSGEDPTTSSKKYTGPVDMPEGETLFKAVLVTSDGRLSGITTRNYMLETGE